MSLLDRVKQSLKEKEAEEATASQGESDDDENPDFEESFKFYDKKWVIAPFMNEIRAGDLEKIPIECMFSHYILFSRDLHCYYIGLQNHENGDEFEIYEFDFPLERGKEDEDPDIDFKEVESSLNSIEVAHFLGDRIKEGYKIFIPERKEFE